MSKVVYTKQCSDGSACSGGYGSPCFIPDEYDKCDFCLLHSVGLTRATYDRCSDPYAMNNLYSEEDVVDALRRLGHG